MLDIFVEFFNVIAFVSLNCLSMVLFAIVWGLWKNRHISFSADDYYITMGFNKRTGKIMFKKILSKDSVARLLK